MNVNRKKIITLEFNELCPDLLARWMKAGELPNFRRFFEQSQVITALADEPGPDNLEPWIQWYSFHTGLPYREHGVQHLTDGPIAPFLDVWQILANSGFSVANCGSMNARALNRPGSLFIPDPWCTNQSAYPAEWNAYHNLISHFVQENSRAHAESMGRLSYWDFLKFVTSHGLRAKTVVQIISQLFSDSVLRFDVRWRRAALLDKVQFDVFRHYWRRELPDFSSFFLNSTAHYQHAYWHCAFPEQFPEQPDAKSIKSFGSAVLHGYKQMDALLAEFFRLERFGVLLILCTALSQQSRRRVTDVFYRLKNVPRLLELTGVKALEVLPVMAEQYNLRFPDHALTSSAKSALGALKIEGAPLLAIDQRQPDSLFISSVIRRPVPGEALVSGFPGGSSLPFGEFFYALPTTKVTTHHPESLIWIKTGSHRVHECKVSILDWLPTMLDLFAIDPSKIKAQAIRGQSFLSLVQA